MRPIFRTLKWERIYPLVNTYQEALYVEIYFMYENREFESLL